MWIYLLLLVPLITLVIIKHYFPHRIVWWEVFIPIIATVISIFISKYIIDQVSKSEEYLGYLVNKVEYYESWNEYIHQTCTRTVSCGKNCTTTETYDCSYVENHAEKFYIYFSNKRKGISKKEYLDIKRRFGNSSFVDMRRNYHTKDGDMYFSVWDNSKENSYPITIVGRYTNKVKLSDQSIFNISEVSNEDKEKFGLYDYPNINKLIQYPILGGGTEKQQFDLMYLNGLIGEEKQVRIFILLFEGKDLKAGEYQSWYWTNGNKNELNICIGTDNGKITWLHPFSWTPNIKLLIDIKNDIHNMDTLHLDKIILYLGEKVKQDFVRREFEEFDYLTIEPKPLHIFLSFIFIVIINILTSMYVIKNQYKR